MSTETAHIEKKKTLTPKLRFSEFKQEWDNCALGEKANSISSGKIKPQENGDYLVYGSTGVIGKSNEYSHNGDFILVARVGANAGTINRVMGKYAVTDNTLVIDLKRELLVPFCEAYLKRFGLNRLIFGSGQPLITGGQLKELKISFPSLPEQQKIASFLSAVDEKIQQLTRKKELLEQYKKGVMQQLFSGKLRFKDPNGKPYPKWEEKRLSEITQIRSGISKEQSDKGKYKVTRIETISNGVINEEKVGLIESVVGLDEYKLKKGDILFSNINSVSHIGKTAIAKTDLDIYHGMNLLCFKALSVLEPQFLFYFLNTEKIRNYFKAICNQAVSQASINQTSLGKTKISVPELREQQKIASFLTALDAKIEAVANQITQAQTFKKGLLQQMFV